VWQLFNLGDPKGILWSALPRQLPTVLALAFVVAFGSSLDVAAIQQGSPDELDYNRELVTVGAQQLSYVASLLCHDVRATCRQNSSVFDCSSCLLCYLPCRSVKCLGRRGGRRHDRCTLHSSPYIDLMPLRIGKRICRSVDAEN
jgi:hypothetical protein